MPSVDYAIVGAGISGLTLRRFLRNENTVLLDHDPGSYKIGESIIPEHNHHLGIRALLPKVRELPSYTPKLGSTFASKDTIAAFPLPANLAALAMHIERSELERLMIKEWSLSIRVEKVTAVDVDAKTVTTNKETYQVEKQIIDCSGPAMVIASARDEKQSIRPVYCTWSYWDIVEDACLSASELSSQLGKKLTTYDATEARLWEGELPKNWCASKTTNLSTVEDGVWMWQIPLFGGTRLSVGIVSRHDKIAEEAYDEIVNANKMPGVKLAKRSRDGESPYDRVHVRNHFAQRAKVASSENHILVADAFAFADPIYSVGTGLAVNKGIQVAEMLNDGGWSKAKSDYYNEQYERLIKVAVAAFEYWYSGELVSDDTVAQTVQQQLLEGRIFSDEIAAYYQASLKLAMGDPQTEQHHEFPDLDGV